MKSKLKWFGFGLVILLLAFQFVTVERTNPPVETSSTPPQAVEQVLRRACFDCHSHETRWPWYSRVAPASWIVAHDVHEARQELNFSAWDGYMPQVRRHKIEEVWAKVATDEMPPAMYVLAHSAARLTDEDRETLRVWARWGGASGIAALVDAERAFAADSAERGMRTSFMAFMAVDAVIFRPHPVNAQEWFEAQPETPGSLVWRPVWAELSAAGDMGYTTGPWEFRADEGGPAAYGQFISVWRRQGDSSWKVIFDAGISHPRVDPTSVLELPQNLPRAAADAGEEASRAAVLEAERELAAAVREDGMRAAFAEHATQTVRLYRQGRLPSVGLDSVDVFLRDHGNRLDWEPAVVDAAVSGDLGYVYGSARAEQADSQAGVASDHYYARIWRRDPSGTWRIAVDLLMPLPAGS